VEQNSQGMEFNRFTLTGEWDAFYIALLKIRLMNDGLPADEDILTHFKEHIERGVVLLYNRVKDFSDLSSLAM
jgi:DNA sulfur modification protein DndE